MTGLACVLAWTSLSGCRTAPSPPPCACGEVQAELERYTASYLDALEDAGNLRHQLKACQERR